MIYTYSKAKDSDMEVLYKAFTTVMKEFIIDIWGWDEEWQLNDFINHYIADHIIVVKNNSHIVGYCQFEELSSHIFISMLIILPEHQSKGIGSKLILMLKKRSSDKAKSLQLNVFKINIKAKLFYEKQGFKVTDETDTSYVMEINI